MSGGRHTPEEERSAPAPAEGDERTDLGQVSHAGDGDAGSAAGAPGGPAPAPDARPLDDVAAMMAERDEYLGALQRLQADFENYRKRVQRQQEERVDRAVADVVVKLLPILDALDLAHAHLLEAEGAEALAEAPAEGTVEGKALVQARSLLLDALAKEGLERIDRSEVEFDPVVHDAVAHVPAPESAASTDHDASPAAAAGPTVGQVLRAGYRWRGQTLRPAMVQVHG